MDSNYVNCLASRACCPEVVKDIADSNMIEEGGFVFKANHLRFFHAGEDEFLPPALSGLDGRLTIKLAGAFFYWRRRTALSSSPQIEGL